MDERQMKVENLLQEIGSASQICIRQAALNLARKHARQILREALAVYNGVNGKGKKLKISPRQTDEISDEEVLCCLEQMFMKEMSVSEIAVLMRGNAWFQEAYTEKPYQTDYEKMVMHIQDGDRCLDQPFVSPEWKDEEEYRMAAYFLILPVMDLARFCTPASLHSVDCRLVQFDREAGFSDRILPG